MNKQTLSMILSLALTLAVVNGLHAEEIASPEDFFGFQLGADRKIARWDAIVEYFEVLAGESDEVLVTDMGPTTNEHPFLLVVVSSAENLARRLNRMDADLRARSPTSSVATRRTSPGSSGCGRSTTRSLTHKGWIRPPLMNWSRKARRSSANP